MGEASCPRPALCVPTPLGVLAACYGLRAPVSVPCTACAVAWQVHDADFTLVWTRPHSFVAGGKGTPNAGFPKAAGRRRPARDGQRAGPHAPGEWSRDQRHQQSHAPRSDALLLALGKGGGSRRCSAVGDGDCWPGSALEGLASRRPALYTPHNHCTHRCPRKAVTNYDCCHPNAAQGPGGGPRTPRTPCCATAACP